MPSFNVGEYGSKLYINIGTDLTSYTDYTVEIEPRSGDSKTFTSNITISGVNITVDDTLYYGDEYLIYTIQDGDLDQLGQWRYRGEVTTTAGGGSLIKSDYVRFTVLP